ncbi:MAG: tyrosine--tRNA ligase [Clostridiales bacterium]|nr:tyrosine--tRNA ligase [Clostridiales bacterium]
MTTVKTNPEIIQRILEKGVEQILPSKDALKERLLSGQRLNIYQGFDPTGETLHIGHSVGMRKLEDFRKLGHHVIFLIGDFTARIGDPTDKAATRKMLTKEDVENNMKRYIEQASHIIDMKNTENPVEVMYNSTWLEKLNFGDIVNLASEFTVQQLLKRDMFQKRLEANKPIHLNEFLYPLMQGYDSVMMDIDIDIGGNDQLFNMLSGRDMVMNHLKKEKIVLAGKLLEDPNGDKMGKTTGNMIRMDDKPEDIYGKVMTFTDGMILIGFEILTIATLEELETYKRRLDSGENPMILKKELALRVTEEITSREEAQKAQQYFQEVFQNKEDSEKIQEIKVNKAVFQIGELLVTIGFAGSKSIARRLVDQGAVKINNEKISDWDSKIDLASYPSLLLKVGKQLCHITVKT